jgi:L-gulonate 5-dehydrogenase
MAVLSKPYDLAIKDVVIPEPIGEQVLVKLKAAGICGSDLECSKDDPIPESSPSP